MTRNEIIIILLGIIALITTLTMFEYMDIAKEQASIIEGYRKDC